MRPIVCTLGSPTYLLAKEMVSILAPLVGNSDYTVKNYTVKNSKEFVERIRTIKLTPKDGLVSFDVVSLFTEVQIVSALKTVEFRLRNDSTLEDRTQIPVEKFVELIELCLRSTYFEFQGEFYEQIDGAAMGSPLSPIIANLFMEDLENSALTSALLKPNLWIRYVDDTFVVWSHGVDNLHHFHGHLNQQSPSIKFTREDEKQNRIAFLDVLVTRLDVSLSTLVYRKPTNTDRYIPFHSYHHPRTIAGVMKGMRERAFCICDNISLRGELEHLEKVFLANELPNRLIKKILSVHPKNLPLDSSMPVQQD